MRPAHVYIFWRNTTALYVGCTVNLARRMKEHHTHSPFAPEATHVTLLAFADRDEALRVESRYIRKLRPAHNVRDNPARRDLVDALALLEYDAPWFAEQPQWLQRVVNDVLEISPRDAARRMEHGLVARAAS